MFWARALSFVYVRPVDHRRGSFVTGWRGEKRTYINRCRRRRYNATVVPCVRVNGVTSLRRRRSVSWHAMCYYLLFVVGRSTDEMWRETEWDKIFLKKTRLDKIMQQKTKSKNQCLPVITWVDRILHYYPFIHLILLGGIGYGRPSEPVCVITRII